MKWIVVAFLVGLFVRDVIKIAVQRYSAYRFERDFAASEKRMIGCAHARTIRVNTGSWTDKCLDCWAIRITTGPDTAYWISNCAPPPKKVS